MADGIRIVHLFPDLLNLYGDGGNVRCLAQRCRWRSIPVEIVEVKYGDTADLSSADIVFLGGGPDREQRLAADQLLAMKGLLEDYVERDGVLLAICGGYQLLGREWLAGGESVEGLGLIDMTTKRAVERKDRIIGDIVLRSAICDTPVVGYENHAGRTYLGKGVKPFGTVLSSVGRGNNDQDGHDGAWYRNVIGTYLHGTLLGKNPEVADYLLRKAYEVQAGSGDSSVELALLDDAVEHAANAYMLDRLGVSVS